MKTDHIISKITKAAKQYQKHLEGKEVLFIYGTPKNVQYLSAEFTDNSFAHLVGIKPTNREAGINARRLYRNAIEGRLSAEQFTSTGTGTIKMKLDVINAVFDFKRTYTMVGDFNGNGFFLSTEKIAGGVFACMGFRQSNGRKTYYPNTVLKEDIRNTTNPHYPILAILTKRLEEKCFTEVIKTQKGINRDLSNITLPEEIKNKIKLPQIEENKPKENVEAENVEAEKDLRDKIKPKRHRF